MYVPMHSTELNAPRN